MIITASFLSNKLSLVDYGSYAVLSLFMSWIEVVVIGGLSRTSLYKINNADKKLKMSKVILQAYMLSAAIVILILSVSYPIWSRFFKLINLYYLLPIICIHALISALNNGFRQISIVLLKTDAVIIPSLIKHFSKLVFMFCIVSWDANYFNCILAIILSSTVSFCYYYSKLGFLINFNFSKEIFVLFKFTIPIFISTLFLRIFDIADVLLINFFKGQEIAALYSPAHSIKLMFSLLLSASGGFLFTEIAKKNKIDGKIALKPFILKTIIIMFIGSVFIIPANHFIQLLLLKIYNKNFSPSLIYTLPILAGSYFMVFNGVFQMLKLILNKKILIMITSIIMTLIFIIICSVILYNNYPIVYVSYAFLIICLISTFISIVQIFNYIWLGDISFLLFFKVQIIRIMALVNNVIYMLIEFKYVFNTPKQNTHFKVIYNEHQGKNDSLFIKLFPYKLTFCTIEKIVSIGKNDKLICSSIRHYEYLLEHDLFDQQYIFAPSVPIIKLCGDKLALINHFSNSNFAKYFPKTNVTDFPLILKKKEDGASRNIFLIQNQFELIEKTALISDSSFFTQEYISGNIEYSFHPLLINNKIVKYICIEFCYHTDMPIALKTALLYKRRVNLEKNHVDTIQQILNHISYSGFCCVDFKIQNGNIQIFEINPRLGYNARPFIHTYLRHLIN